MMSNEIRKTFLDFFKKRGHAIIPSASLIPENDPTVLFTTAGMHPLVPYLLGAEHQEGKRLSSAQKCIRTGDIEEVGDNRHLTFFEMLGNWSLGDYFKEEAVAWSFELLTSKEEGFGLDPRRLYVTVFAGDENAPEDNVSIELWRKQFASVGIIAEFGERIFAYPKEKNWWGPAGQTGPCGPDTEMFYDTLALQSVHEHAPGWVKDGLCHPNCDCGRFVEIWNDVFMEYRKTAEGTFVPLAQKNVDTGMGLERMAMILQGASTVFETDVFMPIIKKIEELTGMTYKSNDEVVRAMRIIADHVKAAVFIIGDPRGVGPSNTDQGYIVRRLIRRSVRFGRMIGISGIFLPNLAEVVIDLYKESYPELLPHRDRIMSELTNEEEKFSHTLARGMQEAMKMKEDLASFHEIPGDKAFYLYESFGFPKELTEEVLGKKVSDTEFIEALQKHQELSRAGAEQKFAGGLADHSEQTVRMHTATHLLHQALRNVLGNHVEQRGSNITTERLRFDFSHPQKMTSEEIRLVEEMVNQQIAKNLPVHFEMFTPGEAKELGAIGLFDDKYAQLGNKVKVYMVGNEEKGYFSREICGGPHVAQTSEVGKFKIIKEEASSAGVRRIKAVVS